jgi:ABC-type nitrate/sulfonate/bicarbonate transport system permease component
MGLLSRKRRRIYRRRRRACPLFKAISASLYRIVCGFAIAVVVGVTLGATMTRSRLFDRLVDLLRPISPLAIFPLALPWFGIGDASKVFGIAFAASFPR